MGASKEGRMLPVRSEGFVSNSRRTSKVNFPRVPRRGHEDRMRPYPRAFRALLMGSAVSNAIAGNSFSAYVSHQLETCFKTVRYLGTTHRNSARFL